MEVLLALLLPRIWRPSEDSVDPTLSGEPGRVLKEEANPLLLAAYDLVTCATASANCTAATLPISLMQFLRFSEQEHQGPTGGKRENFSLSTRPPARCTESTASNAGSTDNKQNAEHEAAFERKAPVPGEAGRSSALRSPLCLLTQVFVFLASLWNLFICSAAITCHGNQ